jgi:hypothetical protein
MLRPPIFKSSFEMSWVPIFLLNVKPPSYSKVGIVFLVQADRRHSCSFLPMQLCPFPCKLTFPWSPDIVQGIIL